MSCRQLEEKREVEAEKKLAKHIGISIDILGATEYDITEMEGYGGQLNTWIVEFRDTPQHILDKIPGLDENNTLHLDPWYFDEPYDEAFNEKNNLTDLPEELLEYLKI